MNITNVTNTQTQNTTETTNQLNVVQEQISNMESLFQASNNAINSIVKDSDTQSILNEINNAQQSEYSLIYENAQDENIDMSTYSASYKNSENDTTGSSLPIYQAQNDANLSKNTEPEMTLEEFLDNAPNNQARKMYEKLFEKYDYNEFMTRTDVPQLFQTVYGQRFATGTIQSAGCGITSLSMVASYLLDENITPDMLTGGYTGDNPASAMEKGFKKLGLDVETYNGQAAINNLDSALENGPIIARVGKASKFTNAGHFIVITGKTEDGKYIVNDPNLENYYKSNMIDGFTNGFSYKDIIQGLNGIYKISA